MFSSFFLVLVLAALRVSADAAADMAAKKAAEADLVGKLRLAPVATDRIALLSKDDEFAFDFFDPKAAATVGKGGKIVTANSATFPAVIGTGSAMATGFLDACSMNTPHMHPRATEMQISVNSTIRTGMITENGARFIMTELPPGSMTVFPKGSIHFQVNDGCKPALFVASFNSEDPGALQVAQRFLGLPPDIVGATLGDLGVEEVVGLESKIPDNVAIGTDACLKRCGLTRPSQPTLQRQPRVSGNALSGTYSYTGTATATKSTKTATTTHAGTTVYTSYAGTPSPTHPASPVHHLIKVGADGQLKFSPANISASIGDIVTFEFHPKNHTVTQSSFANPCKALAETSTTGQVGFKSGFRPVSMDATSFPTFNITINDTAPIWGYCGQQGPPVHCQMGMVFSINAVESGPNNFEAFQRLANNSGNAASASTKVYSTPPPQSWATQTATVTHGTSKWTTVYTSYAGTPAPTYAASPVHHLIKVGADGQLKFSPANISASIGDIVTFEFHPKNHTVTQSSFSNPCKALAETSKTGQVGFKSGFRPVSMDATSFPTFNITINDTAPIWGYCGQQGPPVHCQQGMVFSINAVESGPNNFEAFQRLANNSGTYYSAPAVDKNLAAAGSGSNSESESSNKPSPALIALLAINGVLVIGVIVLGGLYFRKRRASERVNRHKQLYTSISVSGDPIFAAPEKPYDDAAAPGDTTPLTHGLTHGPYYDPHEPASRSPSRPASRLR
ncbi:RmlC-like cupin [Mycena belliarum]|uniref:RmlC-like cupin n=1 Tax=Mycena belliarum TaxID=1033014 RepID=A0AAD6TYP3_9AGAR|nr:RmlC-like cupin [Mycena belliae]